MTFSGPKHASTGASPRRLLLASPLSLKFILAAELRATIQERTFADG